MKRIIRLTESELTSLVKRLINEDDRDIIPIKELNVDNTMGGQGSFVILDDGSKHRVKLLSSECKYGSYSQDEIPIGCVAKIVANDQSYDCSKKGCEIPTFDKKEVVVRRTNPNHITFDLKVLIDDYDFISYDKRTGEILGGGQKGHVVAKTQPNKDEDWVRDWFKRNRIKVF